MKVVTFVYNGRTRLGALRTGDSGSRVLDLNRLDSRVPPDMLSFLEAGPEARAAAEQVAAAAPQSAELDLAAVILKAPVPRPGKILCVGQNYLEHAAEANAGASPYPIIFAKYANAVIGPGEPIVIPPETEEPDYEAELGVVIGRRARRVPESAALDYVAGYTPLNDVSARDWQRRTGQWLMGKTFDTFAPMGPALVTADEVPDVQNLTVRTVIGGEVLQEASTALMIFPVAFLIAYITQVVTLEPGDVIATGTPAGIGAARKPPRWLRHGDVVRVEIDGVGALENPVVVRIGPRRRIMEASQVVPRRISMGKAIRRVFSVPELSVIFALLVLIGVFDAANGSMLSQANLSTMLQTMSYAGIIVVGMTFLMIAGEIDLSVGGVYALASALAGHLMVRAGWSIEATIAAVLVAGVLVGLFNGIVDGQARDCRPSSLPWA